MYIFNYREAILDFDKAVKLRPNEINFLVDRFLCYRALAIVEPKNEKKYLKLVEGDEILIEVLKSFYLLRAR